jgi:hypothetical protein
VLRLKWRRSKELRAMSMESRLAESRAECSDGRARVMSLPAGNVTRGDRDARESVGERRFQREVAAAGRFPLISLQVGGAPAP